MVEAFTTDTGLTCKLIVDEPIAAAVAFGLHQTVDRPTVKALMLHVGDSSLDISVLTDLDGRVKIMGHAYDLDAGSQLVMNALIDYLADLHKQCTGDDISQDTRARAKLESQASEAIEEFASGNFQAEICVD